MRTLVVGASSGLGRSIAIGLGQRGATVALMARRNDRLADAAKEAGPGALAIACDVTDESSCVAAVEAAAQGLGGIDALVYATGIGPLARMVDVSAETWRRTFDTNVVGAALITAAAIPTSTASAGVAAYLSSVSASFTPPWPGLGAYATSKAALETTDRGLAGRTSRAWDSPGSSSAIPRGVRGHPARSSPPTGTGISRRNSSPIWSARNYLSGSLIEVESWSASWTPYCAAVRAPPSRWWP